MRRIILTLTLAALAPAALAAQPTALQSATPDSMGARPISLEQAIALAQRNSPTAVQARGQERNNHAAVRSAYGSFIPSVSVSTGANRQFVSSTTSNVNGTVQQNARDPWSYSNGLNFNVELFDGGRRYFNLGSVKANVSAAEANTVAQRFSIALNVQQQYFNVLAARESEAAALAQLQQAQQQFRDATAKVAAGAATMSDSLRSVIQVGNAQLALLTAENNLRNANAALTRLVATPFIVTAATGDTLLDRPTAPLDSAELVRLATHGPAVQQAQAQLTAAQASRKASRAPYLPTVGMSYSRSGGGSDAFGFGDNFRVTPRPSSRSIAPGFKQFVRVDDPTYTYSGRLSFSLSYPLFNQFSREEGIVRAEVAEENAQASLRDAGLLAQQNLIQYLGALRTAEQRIQIQLASVAAAEEDLRVQQRRYAVGASILLDVLTSQTTLNQARAALIQARYDYRVAKAQLEALVGRKL